MTMNINFPNLGIYLENVGKTLNVFGFDIAYYGMTIALGVTLGIMLAVILAKKTGQNPDTYYDLATYAIIISIMGARLYYVIFSWDYYKDNLLSIFNLRQGGLAIYGGVIAAIITTFVFAKKKKCSFGLLVDTAGPGHEGRIAVLAVDMGMDILGADVEALCQLRLKAAGIQNGTGTDDLILR